MSLVTGLPTPVHLPYELVTSNTFNIPSFLGVIDARPTANATWTLPALQSIMTFMARGSFLVVKNESNFNITVLTTGSDTIDGASQTVIPAGSILTLATSNTTDWKIISNGSSGGGVLNGTFTVGIDFATIQDALDFFAGKQLGEVTLIVPAGTYPENLDLSGISSAIRFSHLQATQETKGLLIRGDSRRIAGVSYISGGRQSATCDSVYDNNAAPTAIVAYNPPLGTLHGTINLVNVGGTPSNTVAVTIVSAPDVDPDDYEGFAGAIQQPDFNALGVVIGDKVAIRDTAGNLSVRNVTLVNGNEITFNGIATTFDLEGSSITFEPNVQVLNTASTNTPTLAASQTSCSIQGLRFVVDPTATAVRNNLIAIGSSTLQLDGCVFEDIGNVTEGNVALYGNSAIFGSDRSGTQIIDPAVSGASTPYVYDDLVFKGPGPITILGGGFIQLKTLAAGLRMTGSRVYGGSWWLIGGNNAPGSALVAHVSEYGSSEMQATGWKSMMTTDKSVIRAFRYFNGFKCGGGSNPAIALSGGSELVQELGAMILTGQGSSIGIRCQVGSSVKIGRTLLEAGGDNLALKNYDFGIVLQDQSTMGTGLGTGITFDTVPVGYSVTGGSRLCLDNTAIAPNGVLTHVASAPVDSVVEIQELDGGAARLMTLNPTLVFVDQPAYVGKRFSLYGTGTAQAHTLTLGGGATFSGVGINGTTIATFAALSEGEGLTFEVVSTSRVQVLSFNNVLYS